MEHQLTAKAPVLKGHICFTFVVHCWRSLSSLSRSKQHQRVIFVCQAYRRVRRKHPMNPASPKPPLQPERVPGLVLAGQHVPCPKQATEVRMGVWHHDVAVRFYLVMGWVVRPKDEKCDKRSHPY